MPDWIERIAAALSSRKIPKASFGLLIAGLVAVRVAPPDQHQTSLVAGSVAVSLYFTHLFFRNGLELIPKKQRGVVTVVVFALFVALMVIQARAAVELIRGLVAQPPIPSRSAPQPGIPEVREKPLVKVPGCETSEDCDDENACTTQWCDAASRCGYSPVPCNDGNFCTHDSCDPATGCVFEPVVCEDGDDNLCTQGVCIPTEGCVFADVVTPTCDDGNALTADSCDPTTGLCLNLDSVVTCNDDNLCTADSGDPATGRCINVDVVTETCDDGDPCTVDRCDPKTGECAYISDPRC